MADAWFSFLLERVHICPFCTDDIEFDAMRKDVCTFDIDENDADDVVSKVGS